MRVPAGVVVRPVLRPGCRRALHRVSPPTAVGPDTAIFTLGYLVSRVPLCCHRRGVKRRPHLTVSPQGREGHRYARYSQSQTDTGQWLSRRSSDISSSAVPRRCPGNRKAHAAEVMSTSPVVEPRNLIRETNGERGGAEPDDCAPL